MSSFVDDDFDEFVEKYDTLLRLTPPPPSTALVSLSKPAPRQQTVPYSCSSERALSSHKQVGPNALVRYEPPSVQRKIIQVAPRRSEALRILPQPEGRKPHCLDPALALRRVRTEETVDPFSSSCDARERVLTAEEEMFAKAEEKIRSRRRNTLDYFDNASKDLLSFQKRSRENPHATEILTYQLEIQIERVLQSWGQSDYTGNIGAYRLGFIIGVGFSRDNLNWMLKYTLERLRKFKRTQHLSREDLLSLKDYAALCWRFPKAIYSGMSWKTLLEEALEEYLAQHPEKVGFWQ